MYKNIIRFPVDIFAPDILHQEIEDDEFVVFVGRDAEYASHEYHTWLRENQLHYPKCFCYIETITQE